MWHGSLCRTCCRWTQCDLYTFVFFSSCVVRFFSSLMIFFWIVSLQCPRSLTAVSELFVPTPSVYTTVQWEVNEWRNCGKRKARVSRKQWAKMAYESERWKQECIIWPQLLKGLGGRKAGQMLVRYDECPFLSFDSFDKRHCPRGHDRTTSLKRMTSIAFISRKNHRNTRSRLWK